jgi:hypothetical protein
VLLWTSLIFLIYSLCNYIVFSDVGAFQEVWKCYKYIFPIYLICLNLLHGVMEMLGAAKSEGKWGGRVQEVTKWVAKGIF